MLFIDLRIKKKQQELEQVENNIEPPQLDKQSP